MRRRSGSGAAGGLSVSLLSETLLWPVVSLFSLSLTSALYFFLSFDYFGFPLLFYV